MLVLLSDTNQDANSLDQLKSAHHPMHANRLLLPYSLLAQDQELEKATSYIPGLSTTMQLWVQQVLRWGPTWESHL